MPGPEGNGDHGWDNYRRFVVAELTHLGEEATEAKHAAHNAIAKSEEIAERITVSMTTQFGDLRHDLGLLTSAFRAETTNMKVQIAMLQVKSGVWGVAGGMGTVATALFVAWVSGKL